MEEFEKVQLISDAASILVLQAHTLRTHTGIALALQALLANLSPEEFQRLEPEITLITAAMKQTQKQIQKVGTAQSMYIEDLKDKFGVGEGKPSNVRKGSVRKKD